MELTNIYYLVHGAALWHGDICPHPVPELFALFALYCIGAV